MLNEYARSKGKTLSELETMTPQQLDKFLSHFYAESRKVDGQLYARKSIQTLISNTSVTLI